MIRSTLTRSAATRGKRLSRANRHNFETGRRYPGVLVLSLSLVFVFPRAFDDEEEDDEYRKNCRSLMKRGAVSARFLRGYNKMAMVVPAFVAVVIQLSTLGVFQGLSDGHVPC